MKRFELAEPVTVEEAAALIADGDGVKLLAGGTALLIVIKQGAFTPARLVSTRRIPGLDRIDEAPDGMLRIGASVTHTQAECSPIIRRRYPALAQAIHFVANARIRNMATLAGNLCHAD
ncbi:MAG: FAD binding domain-containing protein, partial [Deltaproteobacteria bacterium]|nr:FAD binding domain-containing protein [Deltaproteobacteria bacterium]